MREILAKRPRAQIEFWTDKKYYKNVSKTVTDLGLRWSQDDAESDARSVAKLAEKAPRGERFGQSKTEAFIRVRKIWAGKYHRYAGWKLRDYFEHLDITIKDLIWGNIKGFFGFTGGLLQSFVRLICKNDRPDAIFLKGGFVGLPVGLVARLLKIPYVIHESDAVPGLANRILTKKAAVVATGMPDVSGQTEGKIVWVGTPVAPEYKPVTPARQKRLKKSLGFAPDKPLVVITGGSQGALNIDLAMREILPEMLKFTSVGLQVGAKHYDEFLDLKQYENWDDAKLVSNFRMWKFCTSMADLLGAADVVISRAGATTIAELAAIGKAVILVPFERLPGAHQVKNADHLAESDAVEVLYDARMSEQPGLLLEKTKHLVYSPKRRETLAHNLHAEAKTDAATKLATMIIEVAKG